MTDDADRTRRAVVREGYDVVAAAYAAERDDDPLEADLVASALRDLPADSRVLDAGCGQGTPVLDRLPGGVRGLGLDFSRVQLTRARERTDAALVRGDLAALPVASESCDAVTCLHALIHVPTAEHPTVLSEFSRVLRPGGRLLLTAGTVGWAGANDDWLGGGARMEWSFPGATATRASLREAGFAVTDERRLAEDVSDADDDGTWAFLTATLREDRGAVPEDCGDARANGRD